MRTFGSSCWKILASYKKGTRQDILTVARACCPGTDLGLAIQALVSEDAAGHTHYLGGEGAYGHGELCTRNLSPTRSEGLHIPPHSGGSLPSARPAWANQSSLSRA